jgi:hypothetical protein
VSTLTASLNNQCHMTSRLGHQLVAFLRPPPGGKCQDNSSIKPRPFLSKHFSVHYLSVIFRLYVVWDKISERKPAYAWGEWKTVSGHRWETRDTSTQLKPMNMQTESYSEMSVELYRTVCSYFPKDLKLIRPRGSVVGWGNMLQAVRSRVRVPMRSLNFFQLT